MAPTAYLAPTVHDVVDGTGGVVVEAGGFVVDWDVVGGGDVVGGLVVVAGDVAVVVVVDVVDVVVPPRISMPTQE